MKAWSTLLFIAFLTASLSACGGSRSSGLCENVQLGEAKVGDLAAVEAAATKAYAARKDEAQLKAAIANLREAVAIAPKKTENYIKLAKALYLWGDGYLRFQEEDEAMIKAFEEATYFSEKALQIQNGDFQFSVCSREPFDKSVKKLRKADVPAVYWYAAALGKYGLAKSIVVVLDNKDRIYSMMRRVRKLDPEYHHGASDRYLGAFHTKIPFPKGDLKKSLAYFKKSLSRSNNYLATHVLIAQMLAPKLKDRALFEKHLKFVIDAPLNIVPGLEPEAAIEKKKAEELMEDIDTIFVSEE